MPRRRPIEMNTHHERWLVSYSDFITLLFAFFVVMYSISQVSESKYRVLSDTLTTAFHQQRPLLSIDPINIGTPIVAARPSVIQGGGEFESEHIMLGDGSFDKTADLPQLSDMFENEFADLIADQEVQIHSNEMWLEVELKSSVLFDSGEAKPTAVAQSVFSDVATLLKGFNNPIQVEGFTDNVPINNARYDSNWELSSARAAAAVKLLQQNGIAPERLAAVGYGEHHPVADNNTEEGRAANRRVVLMIAREKVNRPNVTTAEDIESVVKPTQVEVSQPYVQPGLERASAAVNDGKELTDLLIPTPTEETTEIDGEAVDGEAVDTPIRDRLAPVGGIQPVETKDGGLLFSSDPDLPRN